LQDRPRFRSSAAVRFSDYDRAVDATRAVVQSGLQPANCRLLDELEAAQSAGSGGGAHLLVLGFESADHPQVTDMDRALELCAELGGEAGDSVRHSAPDEGGGSGGGEGAGRQGAVGAWRNAFIRAPYGRDALVGMSMIVDTFETACTWDAFPALHAGATAAVEDSLRRICGNGYVTCRFTHVYPDGPAPYFSVMAPGRPGSEVSRWDEIKAAASEAVLAHGGTITHHHAVGRDHRPWYDRQRPDLFAAALRGAKAVVDPAGIMNPGVLLDPGA
ncbi:MAG TPA: FAD-linked oxidase C-terminal domain-containing protein, partial [Acidimicrobiales bacterium]|nr:FAD-linked oxidase C-terminal domain-containing protein [Acidimicrobiales bacterium]